jgi:hypothetical protein
VRVAVKLKIPLTLFIIVKPVNNTNFIDPNYALYFTKEEGIWCYNLFGNLPQISMMKVILTEDT